MKFPSGIIRPLLLAFFRRKRGKRRKRKEKGREDFDPSEKKV